MQRSGSGWLQETLSLRSGGRVKPGYELFCDFNGPERHPGPGLGCGCGGTQETPSNSAVWRCTCAFEHEYVRQARDESNERLIGFKFILPHNRQTTSPVAFRTLAKAVCTLNVPTVFIWRANVLRRYISMHALLWSNTEFGRDMAHPTDAQQTEMLGAHKPSVQRLHDLVRQIEQEQASQRAVEAAFASESCAATRSALTFYYEQLIDGAKGSAARWGELLRLLHVWPQSHLKVIHAERPLLETISNTDEVVRTLNATPHAWMLTSDLPPSIADPVAHV
eukprot:CAMPEP_0119318852 /NCGR_PEP_ID=MMETSP1333-20130426/47802_1 /TAXON_ID=418940 /ORGANISM="Scyphosphaera apsteinii, Strain RCC1455" /LENGTH=278 /DNA_ID=CAMNT_0007325143 /DNA_START=378 /DNA_END=1214 /DNA_ORIENTATION=+